MSTERVTQLLRENYAYLRTEYGVEKIGIFGSHSSGSAQADSDIDLVITFNRPIGFQIMSLAEYLEHLLGSPVDILTEDGVEGIRVPEIAAEIQDSLAYV